MFPLHIVQLKEYSYLQPRRKHTNLLLKRLLAMITSGQVILQAIQQVPLEAIVETWWGAWRLLKQCCHDFLLIWRQFSSANVNVNVKHTITHKSSRNRIWKAGIFHFYYSFSICPSLYRIWWQHCFKLDMLYCYKTSRSIKCLIQYTHTCLTTALLNITEWQFMRTLNNHWKCTSGFVQSGQSEESFNVAVTSNHQDHNWITRRGVA